MVLCSLQFAATACTIVSGAIAERARVEAYAIYSFFMAAWVYPVIVHSIWSSAGWASMFRWAFLHATHQGRGTDCPWSAPSLSQLHTSTSILALLLPGL